MEVGIRRRNCGGEFEECNGGKCRWSDSEVHCGTDVGIREADFKEADQVDCGDQDRDKRS